MLKRVLPIAVSLFVLGLIYWRIDVRELARLLSGADLVWLLPGIAMTAATTYLTAYRLAVMAPGQTRISSWECVRLVLGASVLNMVLPSKLGDLAKAWFLRQRGHLSGPLAFSLVVFEKASDVTALLLWCAIGLTWIPWTTSLHALAAAAIGAGGVFFVLMLGSLRFAEWVFGILTRRAPARLTSKLEALRDAWRQMHGYFWSDGRRLASVAVLSLLLWLLHLVQIWTFIRALGGVVPLVDSVALTPLAIFVGLLPFSLAGIGTRDAALIFFYSPYFDAEFGAALGILCTLRYVIPGLAGIPFFGMVTEGLRADPSAQVPRDTGHPGAKDSIDS